MEKHEFQAQTGLNSQLFADCLCILGTGQAWSSAAWPAVQNSLCPCSSSHSFRALWSLPELSSPINPWQAFPSVKSYLFPWQGIVVFMVTHHPGGWRFIPCRTASPC